MNNEAAINVSVSSHYREASYASEVTSQGILGERVEVLEPGPLFTLIRQTDGYESWISSDQLAREQLDTDTSVLVRSHFVSLQQQPATGAEVIRDAVIGCRLPVREEQDGWYRLGLPDGQSGWAPKKDFGSFPSASPQNVIELAREFLGYQYVWGGRTPKGFDCSGLVQTVFGLLGVHIPRDSRQQQKRYFRSSDFRDAEPGDLLFFGASEETITHVAIALGNLRFTHASGWVRYNSLRHSDPDFSPKHLDTFISVNRYPLDQGVI
jgi:cell wall-associated NlpC family hydrolase